MRTITVSIIAFADGYQQAGFQPVTINPAQPATLDLMLLPKNGSPHFAHAQWADFAGSEAPYGVDLRGQRHRRHPGRRIRR